MRNTLVPQRGQIPCVAGRLFFKVMALGFLISTFFLHFIQYACIFEPSFTVLLSSVTDKLVFVNTAWAENRVIERLFTVYGLIFTVSPALVPRKVLVLPSARDTSKYPLLPIRASSPFPSL